MPTTGARQADLPSVAADLAGVALGARARLLDWAPFDAGLYCGTHVDIRCRTPGGVNKQHRTRRGKLIIRSRGVLNRCRSGKTRRNRGVSPGLVTYASIKPCICEITLCRGVYPDKGASSTNNMCARCIPRIERPTWSVNHWQASGGECIKGSIHYDYPPLRA